MNVVSNSNSWLTPSSATHSRVVITSDVSVIGHVISYINNSSIELNHIRKCRSRMWSRQEQSLFIESLILRLPTPPLYFNVSNGSCWTIIDGYQRLITLKSYIVDNAFVLTNLELARQYEGMNFNNLPNSTKRAILETPIIVQKIAEDNNFITINSYYRRLNFKSPSQSDSQLSLSYASTKTWEFLDELVPLVQNLYGGALSGLKPYEKILSFFNALRNYQSADSQVTKNYTEQINETLFNLNNADNIFLNNLKAYFNDAYNRCHELLSKSHCNSLQEHASNMLINENQFGRLMLFLANLTDNRWIGVKNSINLNGISQASNIDELLLEVQKKLNN